MKQYLQSWKQRRQTRSVHHSAFPCSRPGLEVFLGGRHQEPRMNVGASSPVSPRGNVENLWMEMSLWRECVQCRGRRDGMVGAWTWRVMSCGEPISQMSCGFMVMLKVLRCFPVNLFPTLHDSDANVIDVVCLGPARVWCAWECRAVIRPWMDQHRWWWSGPPVSPCPDPVHIILCAGLHYLRPAGMVLGITIVGSKVCTYVQISNHHGRQTFVSYKGVSLGIVNIHKIKYTVWSTWSYLLSLKIDLTHSV
jgi:hypothetical protein